MTPDIESYYETYFDLFLTDGWKQFIEDIQENASSFNIRHVENEGSLKFIQGQLTVMDTILNWQVAIEATYKEIKEERE
jgi:hypothetical protein